MCAVSLSQFTQFYTEIAKQLNWIRWQVEVESWEWTLSRQRALITSSLITTVWHITALHCPPNYCKTTFLFSVWGHIFDSIPMHIYVSTLITNGAIKYNWMELQWVNWTPRDNLICLTFLSSLTKIDGNSRNSHIWFVTIISIGHYYNFEAKN